MNETELATTFQAAVLSARVVPSQVAHEPCRTLGHVSPPRSGVGCDYAGLFSAATSNTDTQVSAGLSVWLDVIRNGMPRVSVLASVASCDVPTTYHCASKLKHVRNLFDSSSACQVPTPQSTLVSMSEVTQLLHSIDAGETDALERPKPAAVAVAPEEPVTQQIGRCKLLEKLGEGGFGEVWMAEQREPVKRRVALRITEDRDQCQLPTPERLKLFIEVCKAVQHAHRRASSTATSSPRTSWSPSTTARPCPRSLTSASPRPRSRS